MRTHGQLNWTSTGIAPRQRDSEGLVPPPEWIEDFNLEPRPVQALSPRDEAVFFLHIAAEVEHALMIQYLYAAYAFGPVPSLPPQHREWVDSIKHIARQEMGHLVTVQNLLLAIGGAINFEREDYPYRSEFYPFHFSLERPTKDLLAKFVVAEMPPWSVVAQLPPAQRRLALAAFARAAASSSGPFVNRVGALYARIINVVRSLTPDCFDFGTAATYQAHSDEVGGEGPGGGSPMDSIMVWPIDSQETALEALQLISDQGEGPHRYLAKSHFDRFLTIFNEFPETNPLYGPVAPNPARPVPTNPTLVGLVGNANKLTDPLTVQVAQFANLRYRLVLDGLRHYLFLDRTSRRNCKTLLGQWVVHEMVYTVRPVCVSLTDLSRQVPPIFVGCEKAVAACPFALPYTLDLPADPSARWRCHIDLLDTSGAIAESVIADSQCPPALRAELEPILEEDVLTRAWLDRAAHDPSIDCSGN